MEELEEGFLDFKVSHGYNMLPSLGVFVSVTTAF
jgi:hypothetical protein